MNELLNIERTLILFLIIYSIIYMHYFLNACVHLNEDVTLISPLNIICMNSYDIGCPYNEVNYVIVSFVVVH